MDQERHASISRTDRLLDEGLVSVVEAAAAEGIRICARTALRWCIAGVRGIRLESLKIAGRRMTSRAALRRFVAATQTAPRTAGDANTSSGGPPPAAGPYLLDDAAAERILRAYGLGRDQLQVRAQRRKRKGAPPRA